MKINQPILDILYEIKFGHTSRSTLNIKKKEYLLSKTSLATNHSRLNQKRNGKVQVSEDFHSLIQYIIRKGTGTGTGTGRVI
jgi:hypothetical protein